jgi:hypothetical protein
VKLVTQTCVRCGQEFRIETDLLGNADSAVCVPCLSAKPIEFESTRTKQTRLFSGLDCLPGQQDLFTDLDRRD